MASPTIAGRAEHFLLVIHGRNYWPLTHDLSNHHNTHQFPENLKGPKIRIASEGPRQPHNSMQRNELESGFNVTQLT